MGLFDFLKPKQNQKLYTGGDGSSSQNAVVINTTSSIIGIDAETDTMNFEELKEHSEVHLGK